MDHTRPAMEKGLLSKLVYPELTTTQKLSITGENFHFWKFKIPFLLADNDLHHLLEPPSSNLETETIPMSDSTLENEFAVKLICQTLDNQLSVEYEPNNLYEAKSMLKSLFTRFQDSIDKASKILEYKNHCMAANANINRHIFRMRAMAKELEVAGVKIPDKLQAMMLLSSLPGDFKQDVLDLLKGFYRDKKELSFFNVSRRLAVIRDERKLKKLLKGEKRMFPGYIKYPERKGDNQEATTHLTERIYPVLKSAWKLTSACKTRNFSVWTDILGSVLSDNGVEYVLKNPKPSEEEAELYKKWQKDDFTCRHLMLGAMDNDLFLSFHDYPTAKTLMEAAEACFNTTSTTRKLVLLKRYLNHRGSDSVPPDLHLDKMDLKNRKIDKSGLKIPIEMQSVVLPSSLPESWGGLVLQRETIIPLDTTCTIDDLRSRVRELGPILEAVLVNEEKLARERAEKWLEHQKHEENVS